MQLQRGKRGEGGSGGKGDHWHVDDSSRARFVFPPEMEKAKARE